MTTTPIPEMSEEEFNAKLAKNVAETAAHMTTLEKARQDSAALRESNDAVDDLRRLREVLMNHVDRTDSHARGVVRNDEWEACDLKVDPAVKCIRLARAVRQTIVLQQEVLGLRAEPDVRAPAAVVSEEAAENAAVEPMRDDGRERREDMRDRENLHDRDDTYDYDDRPYEDVIASIRETFNIAADAKPVPKRRALAPVSAGEADVAALAGAAEPGAYRREHGPP